MHDIAEGEEIFVWYGYDLDYCPDWYLLAWELGEEDITFFLNQIIYIFLGNFTVPDSMKTEYGVG